MTSARRMVGSLAVAAALVAGTTVLATAQASTVDPSSSVTGALSMASHVFCTCMREKPEYIASKDAVFIVLEHTVPAARKAT